ncbi:sulfatase-like hydrolase/transferase [Marinospirillum sp.]|uniref:sulfatase-like hydrolase/transferase n=1 Tax=Marinospirillum sp. TaxID=2183934 RepID=UPI00286FB968|nr:sulfatase-like hydrolase/transferase [Marinospirillum sp.]MDR9469252.1 sulfatase-like hydrolase/transferase [Marinospirillum sp.]
MFLVQLIKTLLVYLLINLPFVLLAGFLDVSRPWFNLDFALILTLFSLGFFWIGTLLAGFFILLDLLAIFVQVFPFIRVSDALYLLQMFFYASESYQLYTLLVGIFFISSWGLIAWLQKHTSRLPSLLNLNALLFMYLLLLGLGFNQDRNHRQVDASMFVQSQSEYFIATRFNGFASLFNGEKDPFKEYAGSSLTNIMQLEGTVADKVLLVVAESWGVPKNLEIQKAILQPLIDLTGSTHQAGDFQFIGATVAAEFRELCNLHPEHFNLKGLNKDYSRCLPNKLQNKGYTSLAVHGATSNVYDRYAWYPDVGFQETLFYENRNWPRRCYSFPGACDLDMLEEVADFLQEPGKRFAYWLTLNSHATYDSRDIFEDHFDCSTFSIHSGEACRNLKLHAQFFSALASKLQSFKESGLQVAVVGDHEPRLMNLAEKNNIFISQRVPWIFFTL